jgi:hypothetical protein
VNAVGDVFVTEQGNNRIQRFDSNGTFLDKWGGTGGGDGEFNSPKDIAFDAVGNAYVMDEDNSRVQKFACSYSSPSPTPTPVLTPFPCTAASITSNFNGTPIAEGRTIWFNAVVKPKLPAAVKTTISFTDQVVTFSANNTTYNVPVPDSRVTYYDSSVTQPTTTFNTTTNTWEIKLPKGPPSGNTFLGGVPFPVPAGGLPGGINPVTWTGNMHADKAKVSVSWKWAAAVYTAFSTDYNALGIKPTDLKTLQYPNSDLAGTPENFKKGAIGTVTGGARGGGGSNYTGSYSATKSLVPCVQVYAYPRIPVLLPGPVSASSTGNLLALAAAALAAGLGVGLYARRRA